MHVIIFMKNYCWEILIVYFNYIYLYILGSDNKIFIWNVGTEEAIVEIDVPDQALSASWNLNGSKFVTTCKDKMMRVFDPRSGDMLGVFIISLLIFA